MANTPVQVTRYPNRRFYVREDSRYVSLQEIEEMVRAGKYVEIRDSQTDEDLTRLVLTRIMLERQPDKMQLFPIDMLHFILRSNDVMTDFLRDYLRNSLPYLEYLQRYSAAAMTLAQPMHWVKALLESNAPKPPATGEKPEPEDAASLAKRVAELEEQIRQLASARTERKQRTS